MEWINRTKTVKVALVILAISIGIASLWFSNRLVKQLSAEEQSRMEVWTEAMHAFNNADENTDLSLVVTVIRGNSTIPVIILDDKGGIESSANVSIHGDTIACLMKRAARMREAGRVIRMDMDEGDTWYDVCYDNSNLLRLLAVYPYIQFGVFVAFVLVAVIALLSIKRNEQDRVWVGLSRETAHQLGTPISSLMAWTEILRTNYPDDTLLPEIDKDVTRLRMVAERFSKIGSAPELEAQDVNVSLKNVEGYMRRRVSDKIQLVCHCTDHPLSALMSAPLFEWVVENLIKNAVDAMDGEGIITIDVVALNQKIAVDISDTGKGIAKSQWSSIFSPGFTTKERGWGLGLSLAKRIIEEYHKGHIFVKQSELGAGTTFRIELMR